MHGNTMHSTDMYCCGLALVVAHGTLMLSTEIYAVLNTARLASWLALPLDLRGSGLARAFALARQLAVALGVAP